MNYTLNETFEMSGYTAHIEADKNLSAMITNSFMMTVRDTLSNESVVYVKKDLAKLGITDTTGTDPDMWLINSCIKNKGMLINFNGSTCTFKQIIPCVHHQGGLNVPIGYNSSEITISFDDNPDNDIKFYSKLLPFFIRDLPRTDDGLNEPIIEDTSYSGRVDYDFDKMSSEEKLKLGMMSTNIKYDSVGDLYVNNDRGHITKYEKGKPVSPSITRTTPKYYSDVSACYVTTEQIVDGKGSIEPNYSSMKSYIRNDITNEESDIVCQPLLQQQDVTLNFFDCESTIRYDSFRQYFDDFYFQGEYRRNIVGFDLGFHNYGIHKLDIDRLTIDLTNKQFDSLSFHIENPNVLDGENEHPLNHQQIIYKVFFSKGTKNERGEFEFLPWEEVTNTSKVTNVDDKSSTDNYIDLTVTNFDPSCGYRIEVQAWLDTAIPGYSSDLVIDSTKAIHGPNQSTDVYDNNYEPLEIEYKCVLQDSLWSNDLLFSEVTAKYLNRKDQYTLSKPVRMDDDQYCLVKFKVINKNYNKEYYNPYDYSITVNMSNKVNIGTEAKLKIDEQNTNNTFIPYTDTAHRYDDDDPEVEYVFYVYNIKLTDITENDHSHFDIDLDATNINFGDFECVWNTVQGVTPAFYLNEVAKIPVDIYTSQEGQTAGYGTQCKKYVGKSSSTFDPTNPSTYTVADPSHELNLYYDTNKNLIPSTSEYGYMKFTLVDHNKQSFRENATFEIDINSDDNTQIILYVINGHYDHQYTIQNPKFSLKSNPDDTRYISDGIITFEIWDINPQTVTVECDAYELASNYHPSHVTWTSKKFIPDNWEFFKDFTIFTKSKLDLHGAYVGVKSLYCTAVSVSNNGFIDTNWVNPTTGETACIYVDGADTEDYFDGKKISVQALNWYPSSRITTIMGDRGDPRGDAQYRVDNNQLNGFDGYGSGNRMFYSTYANARFKIVNNDNFDYQNLVRVSNDCIMNFPTNATGTQPISDTITKVTKTIPPLPRFENLQYGTEDIHIEGRSSYTFDANGGIQEYGSLSIGGGDNAQNSTEVHFKPGEYHFTSISSNPYIKFIIDCDGTKGEYVRICVRDRCVFANNFQVENVNDDYMSFMIYSEWNSDAHGGEAAVDVAAGQLFYNYGVIIAPDGKVNFNNGDTAWCGAIWADELTLQNGVAFIGNKGFA